ncbi:MAG: hypothetical protein IPK07_02125 [Deltaproteobacteria bacterium]|nr:hypothetical protein [Deltaproteobacteria bacterium]
MKLDRVVLAPKLTALEYDTHRYNRTQVEMLSIYRSRNVDAERILASHERQKACLAAVARLFPRAHVVHRNQLSKEATGDADLVIALGGDNHFTYVAHYAEAPILGLNSDPVGSEGVLLGFSSTGLDGLVRALESDAVDVEEWPRIRTTLDGRVIEPAITECFFGERESAFASYNLLTLDGSETTHRGSGTLVVNGAGSTGWYLSAARYRGGQPFKRTERVLRVLAREPSPHAKHNRITELTVRDGEVARIVSNNDTHGVVACDSLAEFRYDFPPGTVAEVSLDTAVTRVVRPKAS